MWAVCLQEYIRIFTWVIRRVIKIVIIFSSKTYTIRFIIPVLTACWESILLALRSLLLAASKSSLREEEEIIFQVIIIS